MFEYEKQLQDEVGALYELAQSSQSVTFIFLQELSKRGDASMPEIVHSMFVQKMLLLV